MQFHLVQFHFIIKWTFNLTECGENKAHAVTHRRCNVRLSFSTCCSVLKLTGDSRRKSKTNFEHKKLMGVNGKMSESLLPVQAVIKPVVYLWLG